MPPASPDNDPLFGNPASDLLRGAMEDAPSATPAPTWEPPTPEQLATLLPQYEIERMLGRGGMGAVYQGRQIALDRPVAVKILSNHLMGTDASFAGRFKNEARAMARLSHPGIVTVYDFGETAGGLLYIVMEFVEGTDVGAMIIQQGRLHSEHAMAITAHVCDALAYAHGLGIIHRDIKPANIMLRNDGVVKVADFGLAKFSSEDGKSQGLTQSGMAIGTPHFVAPEALMLGMTLDHRADIYSVGVMLYQMLTGKLPQGLFELPSLQIPGLDPRYDAIIGKALRENREVRYPCVQDLRRDLDAILTQPVAKVHAGAEEVPAALTKKVRSQRASGKPHPSPDGQPGLAALPKSSTRGLLTVVLLVLAGLAAFYFFGMDRGQITPSAVSLPRAGEWMDLLALADSQTGTVSGKWSRVTDGLQGERLPDGKGAQVLQLPYEPPEEYDFRVAFTTLEGNAEITQILSAFGRQFTWGTACGQPEKWAGFNKIHGKMMMHSGGGVKLPARRELNRRYESLVEVRRDRVTGYVDGERLVEWKTDYSDLSLDPSNVIPNPRALGIGIWWSKTVFHEISVREVTGKGTRLSPPPAIATHSSPPLGDPAKATKDQPFVNSLGMKFVPVPGTTILMCIHETRKGDYRTYAGANSPVHGGWEKPHRDGIPVSFSDDHPVCNVSWEDATAFCDWLGKKEQQRYRLPTDREWSMAVGIAGREDASLTPGSLNEKVPGEYTWGSQWPPPKGAGNYADTAAKKVFPEMKTLEGYTDGFATSAPVMSLSPNAFGIYDLGGNVWEFCGDFFDKAKTLRVVRGGCWGDGGDALRPLLATGRNGNKTLDRHDSRGFRCVLEMADAAYSPPPRPDASTPSKASDPTKDQPFINSLGMKFVPVPGTDVLFCIHETRKADYAAFAADTPGVNGFWKNPSQDGVPVSFADDHPVCNISWKECRDFCQWLSQNEGRTYRLPTDREWSFAVGIGDREDADVSPHLLSDRLKGEFPWGHQWPPPAGAGNLGDSVMATKFPKRRVIPGYTDGFATTAPVMSFAPNPFGLYDLSGNVWEFCEDWYDETQMAHVIRGLNFDDGGDSSVRFLSSHRGWCPAPNRHANHGFRVVLER